MSKEVKLSDTKPAGGNELMYEYRTAHRTLSVCVYCDFPNGCENTRWKKGCESFFFFSELSV